jgi:NitT/TauT family transport system substrate-binding protein
MAIRKPSMTNQDPTAPGQFAAKPRGRFNLPLALGLLALSLMAALAAWKLSFSHAPAPASPLAPVSLALPLQINSAPILVAAAQGLFKQAGVDVTVQTHKLGKDALTALLEGKADLAVVTDTPFLFARMGGNDIAAVAGISQARRTLAIVARSDRGINAVEDLIGKNIALQMGTNFMYFLEAMLQAHQIESDKVQMTDMKFDDAIAAVTNGKVDAAVLNQPTLARMQEAMGSQIKLFFGEDVFAFRYLVVGKSAYIDAHPQEVQRVLSGLLAAIQAIHADPAAARKLMGETLKFDDALMSKVFDPTDYVMSLDQAMLLALDDETRWAMKRGLIKPGPMPNQLESFKFKPLEAVAPAAVKIVH